MKVTSPIFTICGTPTYVAPEILSEEGYGLEVDVWAAGVILYIMLCGFPPFRSPNRKQTELFDLIEKCDYEFLEPYWEDVSEDAKDLISKILVADRSTRLTAKQVFNHPWLCQYGLDRNNTILNLSTRRGSNRFRTAARSIQAMERMKLILRLEREKCQSNITVHHEKDEEGEEGEQQHQGQQETIENADEKMIDNDTLLNDFITKADKEDKPSSDDNNSIEGESNYILQSDTTNDSGEENEVTPIDDSPRTVPAEDDDQGNEGTTDDEVVKDEVKNPDQLSDSEDSADLAVSKDGEEDTVEVPKKTEEDNQKSPKDDQSSTANDARDIEDSEKEEENDKPNDIINDKENEVAPSNFETNEKEDENEIPSKVECEQVKQDITSEEDEENEDTSGDKKVENDEQSDKTNDVKDDNNNDLPVNDSNDDKVYHSDPNISIGDTAPDPLSMKTSELKQHTTDSGVESGD